MDVSVHIRNRIRNRIRIRSGLGQDEVLYYQIVELFWDCFLFQCFLDLFWYAGYDSIATVCIEHATSITRLSTCCKVHGSL